MIPFNFLVALVALHTAAISHVDAAKTNSVTSLFIWGADSRQSLVGSVVAAGPSAVTYAIRCAPGVDINDCEYSVPYTITVGPAFYKAAITSTGEWTYSETCDITGTTEAICTQSASGTGAHFEGTSVTKLKAAEITSIAVSLTAGLGKLPVTATAGAGATVPMGMLSLYTFNSNKPIADYQCSRTLGSQITAAPSHNSAAPPSRKCGVALLVLGAVLNVGLL
jgi:hypothetical protein